MIASLMLMALAATPRVFLSVDHPFLPDRPGAVVRVEVEGSHSLDVRLYELHDPEHYLSSRIRPEPDLRSRKGAPPGSTLPQALARLRQDERHRLAPLLTDPALEALHLLAPGSVFEASADLPLLPGERLLRRWALPCGGTQSHSYCDVDLGPLPAGAYLVEGTAGGQAAYAVALSTNLALSARRLPGQLLLYAADSQTGEPRPGVQLTVSGPTGVDQKGVTGPQGTLLVKPGARQLTVSAHSGGSWALLDLDYFTRRGHGPRVWLDTDRGEARPGEMVRVFGVERPPPPASRDLPLSLEDGRGSGVSMGVAHEDERGLFTGTLSVPLGIAEGLGHIVAEVGGRSVAGELWLRDPPPADFGVRVTLPSWSSAAIQVETTTGEPVEARCEWHLLRTPLQPASVLAPSDEPPPTEVVASGEVASDASGSAELALPKLPAGDARYHLEVAAIDYWGRRCLGEVDRTLLEGPVHLELEPDRRVYEPGESAHLVLTASDANGHSSSGTITLKASVAHNGPGGEPQHTNLPPQVIEISAVGRAEVTLPNLEPGYYELEARSGSVSLASSVLFVTSHGGDIPYTPDALTLVPDRTHYQPGDTARVLVLAPFENATALFTAESGEFIRQDVLAVHGSSVLTQMKVGAAGGLTFAVSAIFASQAYQGETAVMVGPSTPALNLEVALTAGSKVNTEEVTVRARDAAGKPVPGVDLVAAWRDTAVERSLGPSLGAFLEPPPAREGQSDVSLDFHRAGYSHGTPASRAEHARADLAPTEGFTPQKGLPGAVPRPLHSLAGGLERLPSTDKAGISHLVISPRDARALRIRVVGLGLAESGKNPSFAEALTTQTLAWPSSTPRVPALLRQGDRALAELELEATSSAQVSINGESVALPAGQILNRVLNLDAAHSKIEVTEGTERLFREVVAVDPEVTWSIRSLGVLTPDHPARIDPSDPSTATRVRFALGGHGLLSMLEAPRTAPADNDFEQRAPSPPGDRRDAELPALARSLARGDLTADVSIASAAVIAQLAPDGSLAATPIEDGDLARTALGLLLLDEAKARGVDVPPDWTDRMRAWVSAHTTKAGPGRALGCWALGGAAPETALTALLDTDTRGELGPLDSAALALTLEERGSSDAAAVATRLEHRAAIAEGLACWESGGCDPTAEASADAIAATSLAVVALSHLRPRSVRLPQAFKFLLRGGNRPGWMMGVGGALVARAVAEVDGTTSESSATVLSGTGAGSPVRVSSNAAAELPADTAPGLVRVRGGPVYMLALQREPTAADAEARGVIERHWSKVDDSGEVPTKEPAGDSIERGSEVWVELSATGLEPGAVVEVEDACPGGFLPFEQPATKGPLADLQAIGGRIHFERGRVFAKLRANKAGVATVGYLARAAIAGHYHAPPARAWVGGSELRSEAGQITIEESP